MLSSRTDSLLIVVISLATAVFSEFVSWYLIYRKPQYKDIKSKIEKESKRLDKSKARHEVDPKKRARKEKEEARMIKDLQMAQTRMASLNMRSTMLLGVVMIGIFWMLNKYYSGVVVAKLPFEPIGFITGLTHRNLPGNDLTDCGLPFLYALCNLGLKATLKKLVGGTAPKVSTHVPSMFTPPDTMQVQ